MNEDKWFTSKLQIASTLQVNPKTVDKWVTRDWFPKQHAQYHAWNKRQVIKAVEAHNEQLAKGISGSDLNQEKRRLECEKLRVVIKTEKERLEQEKIKTLSMKHDVVPADLHRDTITELCRLFTSGLDLLVDKMGSRLRDAKVRTMLKQAVDEVRADISNKCGEVEV